MVLERQSSVVYIHQEYMFEFQPLQSVKGSQPDALIVVVQQESCHIRYHVLMQMVSEVIYRITKTSCNHDIVVMKTLR